MILRCTNKLLTLLGKKGLSLAETPPSDDDWYANVLWFDRRKCLLIVHAGTLFPIFVADIRLAELRPIGRRIVGLLEGALLEEGMPIDTLGRLDPDDVRLAKTASRNVLGVMNEMAFECSLMIEHGGGLGSVKLDELNASLRRGLHTKNGEYERPLELVLARLASRR